jgi:hypothetical protein
VEFLCQGGLEMAKSDALQLGPPAENAIHLCVDI